jgi:hypothetical protein
MFDTINMFLDIKPNQYRLSDLVKTLNQVTEIKREEAIYLSGYLKNYKIGISEQGISLKGSLAKYFLNDNFQTLTRSDSQRAIEQLSDELNLPIEKAKVCRIDFSQNLIMTYEPEAYYSYLGESNHFQRLPQPQSLYYSNGKRQKLFYNKVAEGKAKRNILPEVWNTQKVLRYELRLTSRLTEQLNRNEVKALDLYNEAFYMAIFDKWYNEYQNINKLNSINFNLEEMNSPKDFHKQLELYAIQIIGQDKIMQFIEDMRAKNAFDKPEYYSRAKKEVRELCKEPIHTIKSELITELDKKVRDAKRFYR